MAETQVSQLVSQISEEEVKAQQEAQQQTNPKWPTLTFFGVKFPNRAIRKILEMIEDEFGSDAEVGFNRVVRPILLTQIKIYKEVKDEEKVKQFASKLLKAMIDGVIPDVSPARFLYVKWNNKKVRP